MCSRPLPATAETKEGRPEAALLLTRLFPGHLHCTIPAQCHLSCLVQARGAKAFLDSSGEPLRSGCAAGPYLLKPNVVEAEEVTGREIGSDADALGAVEFFLRQGIELMALSLGAEGLLLVSKQRAVWARPPRVRARNPVGAGDALLAGIAWALERGLPLEEMARWGVATGTAAAMREGVGVGARAEVEALYEQVRLDQVKGD